MPNPISEKKLLVINQERFKKINNDEILVLQSRINDYNWQIEAYTQAIADAEQNILTVQKDILQVELSNQGVDMTIDILDEEKI